MRGSTLRPPSRTGGLALPARPSVASPAVPAPGVVPALSASTAAAHHALNKKQLRAPLVAAGAGRSIAYTSHEGNSWEVTFQPSGATVLVDPWLVGDLTFLDAAWLYVGRKKAFKGLDLAEVCARADAILLSQALPDHAHAPTLAALPDKALPVLCSPAAEGAARKAGFTNVTPLPHGATATVAGGKLRVTATAGALVGPPWSTRENGFVIEQVGSGDGGDDAAAAALRLYYEPHCDAGPGALESLGRVDVVVTPAVSQKIGGFPLVMGDENAVSLCTALAPSVFLPLENAEIQQEGPLAAVIQETGAVGGLQAKLAAAGLGTRVVMPAAAGESVTVEV